MFQISNQTRHWLINTLYPGRMPLLEIIMAVPSTTKDLYESDTILDKPPSNVLYSINSVEATVVLARKRSTKEFVTTVDVIGLVRAKVRPKTVRISVQGPPEKIKTLREADVVPTVDPKEAGADTSQAGSKMVAVKVPEREGLRLSVTPKRVLVKW